MSVASDKSRSPGTVFTPPTVLVGELDYCSGGVQCVRGGLHGSMDPWPGAHKTRDQVVGASHSSVIAGHH